MNEQPRRWPVLRLGATFLTVLLICVACDTATPGTASPEPADDDTSSAAPTKTMCESGADLAVDMAFLSGLDISEDGLLSLVVAVDAALGEARLLVPLMAEEYRPLASDVVVALQDLRDIAEKLEDAETLGEGIATVGEAITRVGEAMDALAAQLREPCPEGES